ncbi:MAG TPA: hypothetical protein VGI13_04110, partial [Candidatus Acidoferrum sp.]
MAPEYKSASASFSPDESGGGGANVKPPLALREPVEHVIHGDRRVDHYAWLRKKDDPRVVAYLEDENRYADGNMKGTGELQEKLYQEMLGRILQTDLSVPYNLRGYSYYTRTEEGKQYGIHCRRREDAGRAGGNPLGKNPLGVGFEDRAEIRRGSAAPLQEEAESAWREEVLLDLNVLAQGHAFLGLGVFEISDDNRFLAYGTDTTGYRQYTLEVKDLRTGALLPFRVERVTSAAWASDNRTLFYVVEDEVTKRSWQLYRHVFGTELNAANSKLTEAKSSAAHLHGAVGDPLLYEEKDERFRIDVERSRSGAYLFLVSNSHTTSEIRYLRADQPDGEFHLIDRREENHEYYVDHHPGSSADLAGGVFFIRTNSGGRTYRLMTAPA